MKKFRTGPNDTAYRIKAEIGEQIIRPVERGSVITGQSDSFRPSFWRRLKRLFRRTR